MKINNVVETDEGVVKFDGELSPEESNMVVEIGLNYLIRAGAFPLVTEALAKAQKEEEEAQGYGEGTNNVH